MNHVLVGGADTLVAEIADSLERSGEYVTYVDAGPTQHMVDLHWCAHLAGRRLGMKVRVTVTESVQLHRSDHSAQVTMSVAPRPEDKGPRLP
jgi:hypothetical protein